MTAPGESSFVLFPLGNKRFAFSSEIVKELARPGELQKFPHRTPLMSGVLVRRGRIVPVCDVAQVLVGPDAPPRKFYLIADRKFDSRQEWTAIPVTGECELVTAPLLPVSNGRPPYVSGLLSVNGQTVEIIDLDKLIAMEAYA